MNVPKVERFDCTSGGVAYCMGCYMMAPNEDGDYVKAEAYDALADEVEALKQGLLSNGCEVVEVASDLIDGTESGPWVRNVRAERLIDVRDALIAAAKTILAFDESGGDEIAVIVHSSAIQDLREAIAVAEKQQTAGAQP